MRYLWLSLLVCASSYAPTVIDGLRALDPQVRLNAAERALEQKRKGEKTMEALYDAATRPWDTRSLDAADSGHAPTAVLASRRAFAAMVELAPDHPQTLKAFLQITQSTANYPEAVLDQAYQFENRMRPRPADVAPLLQSEDLGTRALGVKFYLATGADPAPAVQALKGLMTPEGMQDPVVGPRVTDLLFEMKNKAAPLAEEYRARIWEKIRQGVPDQSKTDRGKRVRLNYALELAEMGEVLTAIDPKMSPETQQTLVDLAATCRRLGATLEGIRLVDLLNEATDQPPWPAVEFFKAKLRQALRLNPDLNVPAFMQDVVAELEDVRRADVPSHLEAIRKTMNARRRAQFIEAAEEHASPRLKRLMSQVEWCRNAFREAQDN